MERKLWVLGSSIRKLQIYCQTNLVNNLKELRDKILQYKEDEKADNINQDIEDEKVKLITDLFMFSEKNN
ncbi:MAG: hypothetical protein IPJ74_05315 [Saprospiraceae bacterium]|nr:hypothetical protein [Saprospiraceae bacterium]